MKRIFYKDKTAIDALLKDNKNLGNKEQFEIVSTILDDIKLNGYEAVRKYTEKFDGINLDESQFRVSEEEIEEAMSYVDADFIEAITLAIENVEKFHKKQMLETTLEESEDGVILGQLIRPVARVGLYVPGGTAAYPSSVVMTAVPAKVAGVKDIIMISPPDSNGRMNPYTLAAARLSGVSNIYKVGGAQGIGVLAYGAGDLKKVDKIVGPGNIYVTIAKKIVYGTVDIDMLAGPSEILVIADDKAKPAYIAADLLSQGEHDKLASSILVTFSEKQANLIENEVEKQLKMLTREDIARTSIENNGAIIIADTIEDGIEFSNAYGPEHLELAIEEPFKWLDSIENAGAVFLGYYTPEPIGDYFAGPNHVLPTNGTSRFYSPLNTHTYLKKTSVISYTREAILKKGKYIEKLASVEGFTAHKNSITVRLKDE
ncbi:MAG: histidinol dehydrogenase [Fusobacteria bacterium]|nr:MAG: histidinol dehydrogenase [Fusobacteriota bacterium]KAF0229717.1 MAG: histidinol [Fusobacteriota bacterium]